MTLRLALAALCLCGLTACAGRAVDLDQPAPPSSAEMDSDPGLPASPVYFEGFWADDQRLYWQGTDGLQSCLEVDCRHTKLTYTTQHYFSAVVGGGRIFWVPSSGRIVACPVAGCSADPVTVAQDRSFNLGGDDRIFAYQDYFYWSSAVDIYRCPVSGCAATPEVVASGAGTESLVFDETHAYWMDVAGGIFSAPLDGSAAPKLLSPRWEQGSLAVGDGYLYWTAGKQVFRCTIASCDVTPPTLLVTADTEISEIKIDDMAMYWLAANSIHSCPLSGCEQPQVLTPPQVAGVTYGFNQSFAIGASDVYWIDGGPVGGFAEAIRRTAK